VWQGIPPLRAERHFGDRVVQCFRDRRAGLDALLCDVLERAPDSDAWVYENQRASYSQLDDRVSCLAHGLTINGVTAGDRVGVLLANRPEFLEVILATARIGAIAVPINVREQPDRDFAAFSEAAAPDAALRCRALPRQRRLRQPLVR
jgi:long-chain acyl-CoA synthetase